MSGVSTDNAEVVNLVVGNLPLVNGGGSVVMHDPNTFNEMIRKLWPSLETYVEKLLTQDLTKTLSGIIEGFAFQKLDFGTQPPVLSNLKLYNGANIEADEIVLDLDVVYAGNMVVKAAWKTIGFGIKDVRVACALRLRLAPLLAHPPFFGCLSISLLQVPAFDFDATGFAALADFKPVHDALHKLISEKLTEQLVIPNAITVPIGSSSDTNGAPQPDLALTEFKCRIPRGLLQVLVVEASSLANHDLFTKSDALARVGVGADIKSTHSLKDTNNPQWNQSLEFDVRESAGALVSVELLDDDSPSKPEPIGRCVTLDFRDAIARVVDGSTLSDLLLVGPMPTPPLPYDTKWYSLLDTKNGRGRVRLGFRYYDYVEKPEFLHNTGRAANTVACVYVHSAQLAAHGKVSTRVVVTLRANGETQSNTEEFSTPVIRDSDQPTWNAFFRWRLPIVLQQAESENYSVQFSLQSEKGEVLGQTNVKLSDVLRSNHLRIANQAYNFTSASAGADSSEANSSLRVSVAIRYVADYSDVQFANLTCSPLEAEVVGIGSSSSSLYRNGRIRLSFIYDPETQTANVTVLRCTGILPFDGAASSKCFVTVQLLPSGQQIMETSSVSGPNPTYNQLFSFAIAPEALADSYFCVSVYYDSIALRIRRLFTNEKAIAGEANHITLNEIRAAAHSGAPAVTKWYDLVPVTCDAKK